MRVQPTHGPITGSGPGFKRAMRLFKARQAKEAEVGAWRHSINKFKRGRTGRTDCDWIILNDEKTRS